MVVLVENASPMKLTVDCPTMQSDLYECFTYRVNPLYILPLRVYDGSIRVRTLTFSTLWLLSVAPHCQKTPRTDGEQKKQSGWGAWLAFLPQFSSTRGVEDTVCPAT